MEPDLAEIPGAWTRRAAGEPDRLAVASRRRALERLQVALRDGTDGPILITGEPGSGKRWLVRRLVALLPGGRLAAGVELTSALDGVELLRLIGDELGLRLPDRLGAARLALAAGLRDAQADGRGWLLVVDETQRASEAVRQELQVLGNGAGRPGGFDAVILLGRTELARELSRPRSTAPLGRVGLHVHLPPMDLGEAREFLLVQLQRLPPESELEVLHRDAMGNPWALRRLADTRLGGFAAAPSNPAAAGRGVESARPARAGLPDETPTAVRALHSGASPGEPSAATADEAVALRTPSLIPSRPPLRLEDGLVEVGWEGDLEAEPTRPEASPTVPESEPAVGVEPHEQRVEDRYAALQAWAEWSRNRERSTPDADEPAVALDEVAADESLDPGPYRGDGPDGDPDLPTSHSVRAESPHEFAPYSQIFSRLRHSL